MDDSITDAPAPAPATRHVVNWGGVLKGVAIVAAVAMVAVVALPAFTALSSYVTGAITASPTASGIAVEIGEAATWLGEAATWLGDKLLYGIGYVGGFIGNLFAPGASVAGLSSVTWTGAAATNQIVGVAGAATATAVAAHAAIPHLNTLQITGDVPVQTHNLSTDTTGILAAQGAQSIHGATHAASLHEVIHAAHHAAESSEHAQHKQWSTQFTNKAAFANHADAVRASQGERSISARNDNFAQQLNADRASLDAALAK